MTGRTLSHYALERCLGAGGMGRVYQARDLALGRPAAVKVLQEGLAPEFRARLLREAEASARLQHPAIATFYEAGEADGEAFIAMEFVPGSTLRELLQPGPLEAGRALAYAGCMLEGLAHAHAAGILHRDIKPENVMATGGHGAKLLDFGLAKRFSREPSASEATEIQLTEEGTILGTIGYMSPEQLHGREVDERSDLFAAGAVLYEMLAGRPAFPGRTATERISAILARDPDPIGRADIPPHLDEVVVRALERDAGRRYPTARAFLADLLADRSGRSSADLPDTVAVLDFENLTGDPADAWIATGVAESVASDLARVPGLSLVPREKIRRLPLGAGASDPAAAGLRLGCRWVLSGSFQRVGQVLRVVWKLTEAATGRALSTDKLDGAVEQIFSIQDRIATAAAAGLDRKAPEPAGAAPDVTAYEFSTRGHTAFHRLGKGSLEEAKEHFEEAVAREATYAPALAGLAAVHAMRFTFTTDPAELTAAAEFARRAIAADPSLAEPHIWLGYAHFREGRFEDAIAQEREAARLDPGRHFAPYFCAVALSASGRREEALELLQRAATLDPEFGFSWLGLGTTHLELGRLNEALWSLEKAASLERSRAPGAPAAMAGYVAECLRRLGKLEEARAMGLTALEDAERSDHMYRDTFRAFTLCALGRIALQQNDPAAAAAAFRQAAAQIRGRARALAGGQLLVQALAGLCRAGEGAGPYEEAKALMERREGFDFQWFWGATEGAAWLDLSSTARSLGRLEEAAEFRRRAVAAGASADGPQDAG